MPPKNSGGSSKFPGGHKVFHRTAQTAFVRVVTPRMKSFLALKVISTWIFVYFQKGFTMKLWQNTQFTTAILFCFIFTA